MRFACENFLFVLPVYKWVLARVKVHHSVQRFRGWKMKIWKFREILPFCNFFCDICEWIWRNVATEANWRQRNNCVRNFWIYDLFILQLTPWIIFFPCEKPSARKQLWVFWKFSWENCEIESENNFWVRFGGKICVMRVNEVENWKFIRI